MSKFIEIGDSALNLTAVSRLELKDSETRTYYVHVKDSAMLYQASEQAVRAALSVLVPIHQEVKIYTLSSDHSEGKLEPEDILLQYRGPATHIISGPLATQSHNCYVSAGFSLVDANEYYESANKAVVHCSGGMYWGVYGGTVSGLGTDMDSSPEEHLRQWFFGLLQENHEE
ncbi:MAG: hypothetical protein KJO32_18715 [Deltaproteobacteria bacterium]|nr:hypothetical protein [Deltaproteobacteria bacterium]